jgi:hypothetical protein
MRIELSHQVIARAAIDFADRSFLCAPVAEPPSGELIAGIKEFGILHPPLFLERAPQEYVIVAGRKRTDAACRILDRETIRCMIIPAHAPEIFIFSLLLEEWLCSGIPSPARQVLFLDRLLENQPPEAALPLLARLGHKPNLHTLRNLLKLRHLPPAGLLALHHGRLSPGSARKLLDLPVDDQHLLIELIGHFNLGGSKQLKLIEYSVELIRRTDSKLAEILASFSPETQDSSDNIPQQAGALLKHLHDQCYPQSTEAAKRFALKTARLNLPGSIEISHTPSFEDDALTLSIHFAHWDAMEKSLGKIRTLINEI